MFTSPQPRVTELKITADDTTTPTSLSVVNSPSTIHHELTTASNRDAKRRRVLTLDFDAFNKSRVKQAEADREGKKRMRDEELRIKMEWEGLRIGEEEGEREVVGQDNKAGKAKKKSRGSS
jgi:hypothetical protein